MPNAIPLPPEEEHRRLFEAFVQCLRALAAQPLILFFDDLHWADHATLDWLGYLADQMRDEPLLLVVAYRTHEAPPELVNYTASWGRDHHLRRLNLEPLTHAETAALVAALAVDTSMADYLHNQSGGNPYYLTELSRIHPDGRPAALQELLAARVRGLPEPAQRLLQAAAILEPTITLAILQEVSQLSEDAVLDALDALLEATVLKERGAQYEFAHPLVAGVVRDNLSHARRTRLHLRAAEALFAVHSDKVDASAGQLAHHYAEADQPAKAAHFADLAANHAAEMAAMAEAVNFYRLATMVEPTTARKLALGEALLHVPSHLQEARETIQAAFVDYEARQDQAGMVQAALHLAVSYLSTEEGEHILPWATRLQAAAASSDSIELEATAHYLLAAGKFHTPGRVPEADDHYRAATRLADNNRLVAEIGLQSWFGWGNYSVQLGDFWPAQMKFQRALEIAQSANNIYFQALSYNNLAYTRLLVDDILGAHSAIEAGLRFVEQHALMRPRQYLYSTRGELALADGALEEAESWFLRGQAEARIYDNQTQVANIHAHLGRVAHAQGDLARAEELLTTARASVSQVSAYFLQIQIELWLGTLYLDQGNPQATQAIIARTQKQLAHAERTALHAKLDALTKQMVEQ